jgi:hypothetical protein
MTITITPNTMTVRLRRSDTHPDLEGLRVALVPLARFHGVTGIRVLRPRPGFVSPDVLATWLGRKAFEP